MTPSLYTFASDSTKLGEIPMHKWTKPWDAKEMRAKNEEAKLLPVETVERKKRGWRIWGKKE